LDENLSPTKGNPRHIWLKVITHRLIEQEICSNPQKPRKTCSSEFKQIFLVLGFLFDEIIIGEGLVFFMISSTDQMS